MYHLLPWPERCRSIQKTETLQTDKSTHKYTPIILQIIIMLKASLEITIRSKSIIFFNPWHERVKKLHFSFSLL